MPRCTDLPRPLPNCWLSRVSLPRPPPVASGNVIHTYVGGTIIHRPYETGLRGGFSAHWPELKASAACLGSLATGIDSKTALQPKRIDCHDSGVGRASRAPQGNGPLLGYPHTQGTNARLATAARRLEHELEPAVQQRKKKRKKTIPRGFQSTQCYAPWTATTASLGTSVA